MLKKLIKWNGEQIRVKACPFCGKVTSLDAFSSREALEDEDIPEEEMQVAVCCDFNNGGCGASGGFRKTLFEAVCLWNKRDEK